MHAGDHCFAIEISELAGVEQYLRQPNGAADSLAALLRQRRESLCQLLLSRDDSDLVIDQRLIVRPKERCDRRVQLVMLCRMNGLSAAQASRRANAFHASLCAIYPELEWRLLSARELPDVLHPFDALEQAILHTRALRVSAHDARRHGIGFGQPGERHPSALDSVLASTAFRDRGPAPLSSLCQLLLDSGAPAMLSIRLRAVRPTSGDAETCMHDIDAHIQRAQALLAAAVTEESGAGLATQLLLTESIAESVLRRVTLATGAVQLSVTLQSAEGIGDATVAALQRLWPANHSEPGHRLGALGVATRVRVVDACVATNEAIALLDLPLPGATSAQLLLSLEDAAGALILPPSPYDQLPAVPVRRWSRLAAPPEVATEGSPLGLSTEGRERRTLAVDAEARLRHQYLVGATGTGKSTLLLHQILDDLEAGRGCAVFDPHGELIRAVLARCSPRARKRVQLFSPATPERSISVNPLALSAHCAPHVRYMAAEGMLDAMRRFQQDEYGPASTEWMGPLFDAHARMNLLLLTSDPAREATLVDFYNLFQSDDAWQQWAPPLWSDPILDNWVATTLPGTRYTRRTDGQMSLGEYVATKFQSFVFHPDVRQLFAGRERRLDVDDLLASGGALLVDLAPARLGRRNSRFVGMMLLSMLLGRMFARAMDDVSRPPFHLYVDEFQTIATSAMEQFLSEGRKFALSLTLANQFMGQVPETLRAAILANVGTLVAFRVGGEDAQLLAPQFQPHFSASDLVALPNHVACVRTTSQRNGVNAFTVRTLPPPCAREPTRGTLPEE